MASSERIFQMLDTQPTVVDPPHPRTCPPSAARSRSTTCRSPTTTSNWVLRRHRCPHPRRREHRDRRARPAPARRRSSVLLGRFYDVQKRRASGSTASTSASCAWRDLRRTSRRAPGSIHLRGHDRVQHPARATRSISDERVQAAARFVNATRSSSAAARLRHGRPGARLSSSVGRSSCRRSPGHRVQPGDPAGPRRGDIVGGQARPRA